MENNQIILEFKQQLKQVGFMGNILTDIANRVINATDNSIYEVLPLCVIQPKTQEDLQLLFKLANEDAFKKLTFTPRGGGTGTNGQSLTQGIVIDTSRYMNNILEFNPNAKTITVEPGVVLSQLNKFLQPHGLFFAPNVSTENRATIGGMIANDAAGKGSLVYGKTNDHVEELSCVLIDGSSVNFKALSNEQLMYINTEDKSSVLARQIKELLEPVQDEITKIFRPLKRPLSGFNLKSAYLGNVVDLTKIIAGSEGTLAFITNAKLKLIPMLKHKALVVTHYASFLDALDDAEFLIKHKPLAIETVDEIVQKSATSLPSWVELAQLMGLDKTESCISNFTEFAEDNLEILHSKINGLEQELRNKNIRFKIIRDTSAITKLWGIRSLAVGLVGKMSGVRKPVAFVEDALVPPQNLRKFVVEFQELLNSYNLSYAMYGHVDVGCVHVRPALDMKNSEDRAKIRLITEDVVKLTDKYQGLLWGEHGKGYRGEFVEHTFGSTLYAVMKKIKAIFDPTNRLNPGKLVTADNTPEKVIKIDFVTLRGELDQKINTQLQVEYAESMLCNGNAACFNQDTSNVMCPSYKVTGDRIHSPKGRAMLVKEWLRTKSQFGETQHTIDTAKIAFEAMQGCLGCKGCAGKCPTQVSIPDLRSKFYDTYYNNYAKRTIREKLMAYLEDLLLVGAKFPSMWNRLIKNQLYPKFGMNKVPQLSLAKTFKYTMSSEGLTIYNGDINIFATLTNPVVIFTDVFVGLLNHDLLIMSCNVLKKCGFTPVVTTPLSSGKAFLMAGWLDKFKQRAQRIKTLLAPLFDRKIQVIGLESSVNLMFRDDYIKFATPLGGRVDTLAEFLANNLDKLQIWRSDNLIKESALLKKHCLIPHCTEQAIFPKDSQLWQKIFNNFGLDLSVTNLGCCGMAGTYGHQLEYKNNSEKLFQMHWAEVLNTQKKEFMATGYSCRTQVKALANIDLKHPIQVLHSYL